MARRRGMQGVGVALVVLATAACGSTVTTSSDDVQSLSGVTSTTSSASSPTESTAVVEATTVTEVEPDAEPLTSQTTSSDTSTPPADSSSAGCETIRAAHWFGEDGVFDLTADPVLTVPGSLRPQSILVRVTGADGTVVEDNAPALPLPSPVCSDHWGWEPSFPGFTTQVADLATPFTIDFEVLIGDPDAPSWLQSSPVVWPDDLVFPYEWEVEVTELVSHMSRGQAIEAVETFLELLAAGDYEAAAAHAIKADWLLEDNVPELSAAIAEGLVTGGLLPAEQLAEWCEIAQCLEPFEIGESSPRTALGWYVDVTWPGGATETFDVGSLEGINVVGLPPRR